jgi:hypothetical protein
MRTVRLHSIGILLGVVASTSGTPASGRAAARPVIPTSSSAIVAALRVSAAAPELIADPALIERLRETPHNYFRFVNPAWAVA